MAPTSGELWKRRGIESDSRSFKEELSVLAVERGFCFEFLVPCVSVWVGDGGLVQSKVSLLYGGIVAARFCMFCNSVYGKMSNFNSVFCDIYKMFF